MQNATSHKPRSERRPLNAAVQFNGRHRPHQGRILNMSEGGMFIDTPHPSAVGERVFLQIQPDESAPIRFNVEGVVVWIRKRASKQISSPKGMGIRFTVNAAQTEKTIAGIFSMLNQLQS